MPFKVKRLSKFSFCNKNICRMYIPTSDCFRNFNYRHPSFIRFHIYIFFTNGRFVATLRAARLLVPISKRVWNSYKNCFSHLFKVKSQLEMVYHTQHWLVEHCRLQVPRFLSLLAVVLCSHFQRSKHFRI